MTFHVPFFDTQRLKQTSYCAWTLAWFILCGLASAEAGCNRKRVLLALAFTWKKSQQDLCSTFFPRLWRSVKLRRHRTLWSFKQLNHTVLSFLCIAKLIRLGVMASLVQAANGSSVSRKPTSISEGIRCLSKKTTFFDQRGSFMQHWFQSPLEPRHK